MSSSPSEIYTLLDQIYQSSFQQRDRLVFYSSHWIPDDLIQHLYEAANLSDISNWFVMFCSRSDLAARLDHLCKDFSSDPVPFQSRTVDIDTTQQIHNGFRVPATLCPEPWTHLEINNKGSIKPCCVSKQTLGDIHRDSLQEIFFSMDMQDLRRQMLAGQQPLGCGQCWQVESLGLISNRIRHLALKKRKLLTEYLSQPAIRSLDLKPGITCNFKCRICSADSSSSHAQEIAKFNRIPAVSSPNWIDTHGEQIIDLADKLENLDLYGGEPFLIKRLTELVHTIVQKGRASQVRLHYNSNGSIFPDFLLADWQHFQHVDLHFSIDNIGARFELERGGSWPQVEKNIVDLLDLDLANLKISIMPTVNVMNVLYLDELLHWADSLGIDTNFNILAQPACLSISALTDRAKQVTLQKYQQNSHPKIRAIVDAVSKTTGSDGKEFISFMEQYDRIRKERFVNTHREIAMAMGMQDTEFF